MTDDNTPVLLSFGEVLWDIIEGHSYLGGAPFNVAAHAAQLGLSAYLVSRVGDDELGRDAKAAAARYGVHVEGTGVDANHATGTVTVQLSSEGQPEYTIHAPVAWDFIEFDPAALQGGGLESAQMDVICFGTLAQRNAVSRLTLQRLLDGFAGTRAFFDVNLRADDFDAAMIEAGLRRASVVKLNDVEARRLAPLLAPEATPAGESAPSLETIASSVRDRYVVDVVLITLGAEGCLVADATGTARVPGRKVTVVDAVGAGDAFSAAFLAAYLRGESPARAAEIGNRLGAFVATQRGAVPQYAEGQDFTEYG